MDACLVHIARLETTLKSRDIIRQAKAVLMTWGVQPAVVVWARRAHAVENELPSAEHSALVKDTPDPDVDVRQ